MENAPYICILIKVQFMQNIPQNSTVRRILNQNSLISGLWRDVAAKDEIKLNVDCISEVKVGCNKLTCANLLTINRNIKYSDSFIEKHLCRRNNKKLIVTLFNRFMT